MAQHDMHNNTCHRWGRRVSVGTHMPRLCWNTHAACVFQHVNTLLSCSNSPSWPSRSRGHVSVVTHMPRLWPLVLRAHMPTLQLLCLTEPLSAQQLAHAPCKAASHQSRKRGPAVMEQGLRRWRRRRVACGALQQVSLAQLLQEVAVVDERKCPAVRVLHLGDARPNAWHRRRLTADCVACGPHLLGRPACPRWGFV